MFNFCELPKIDITLAALFVLIVFYVFNDSQYLKAQSITSDEGAFYDYAKRFVKGDPERHDPRIDNSKMPISVLNVIPRAVEQVLTPQLHKNDWGLSDIIEGRYVTLSISVITIILVFLWAKESYGEHAGLFAAFLMTFCPNNLANAALVTTDSYSVLFLLASMYFLWRFCKSGTLKSFIILSTVIAFSQLVKQSLFHLYILVPICLIVYYLIKKPVIRWQKVIEYLSIFILINWLLINAGYYFYQTNMYLGEYKFMSHLFQTVQKALPARLIVPLPKPFIEGLDMAKYYDQVGGGFDKISSFGKVTILGKESTGGSFWYYYFVSLFYKTPISYLIFFLASIILFIKNIKTKRFFDKEFFLYMPVIYFLVILSFFYKTQCGIRHIIFIFPFIFILSSSIINNAKRFFEKFGILAVSIYLVVSVLMYWRNYYPYTNEFIPDKKNAYAYVGAANLEFLQGKYFFENYLSKHPEVKRPPDFPSTGIFLVTTEEYLNVWNRKKYAWLKKVKPFGQVAYNGLLIKVEKWDLQGN